MAFIISHIYYEGNRCVNRIVNIYLFIQDTQWWDTFPTSICICFSKSRHGFPKYRLS